MGGWWHELHRRPSRGQGRVLGSPLWPQHEATRFHLCGADASTSTTLGTKLKTYFVRLGNLIVHVTPHAARRKAAERAKEVYSSTYCEISGIYNDLLGITHKVKTPWPFGLFSDSITKTRLRIRNAFDLYPCVRGLIAFLFRDSSRAASKADIDDCGCIIDASFSSSLLGSVGCPVVRELANESN